jgi:ribonuclease R
MEHNDIIKFIEKNKLNLKNFNTVIGRMRDKLDLKKSEAIKLVNELKQEGLLVETKEKKLATAKKLKLIKGIVSGNRKGFAFVEPTDTNLPHLFIAPKNLNSAMHNDTVLVKILQSKRGDSTEAEVHSILERGTVNIVGTIEVLKGFGFLKPDNDKFSSDVFIPKHKMLNAKNGQKVVAKIVSYKGKSPEGEIVEVLGDSNSPEIELLSIIRSYDLIEEFSNEVLDYTKKMPLAIKQEDIQNRKDLRDETIITIDGAESKDLDDAICIKYDSKTNLYRLGVHIADVGHYVKRGSLLDKEAYKRGTSAYFPHKVLPMLPRELSNGICSLHPQVDRLTLSVYMHINEKGDVVDSEIFESVINTTERMTYIDVTGILEGDEKLNEKYKHIANDLKTMEKLSSILENKRVKRGSLDFDLPETKIIVDPVSYEVEKLQRVDRGVSNKIIESFMLAANETIAESMNKKKVPFVYRVHEKPTQEKLEAFTEFLAPLGLKVKQDSSPITPKDLQVFLASIEGLEYKDVVNKVLLRSMQKAKYKPECLGHYGLAAKYYTHFTSPIRRYADLTIHRIIKDHLQDKNLKNNSKLKKFVEQASLNASITEVQTEKCSRDIDDYFKAKYMHNKIGKIYEGTISGVTAFGLFVELENTIEGFIRLQSLKGDSYNFDKGKYSLTSNQDSFTLGDKVTIKVVAASAADKRVDFELVS